MAGGALAGPLTATAAAALLAAVIWTARALPVQEDHEIGLEVGAVAMTIVPCFEPVLNPQQQCRAVKALRVHEGYTAWLGARCQANGTP